LSMSTTTRSERRVSCPIPTGRLDSMMTQSRALSIAASMLTIDSLSYNALRETVSGHLCWMLSRSRLAEDEITNVRSGKTIECIERKDVIACGVDVNRGSSHPCGAAEAQRRSTIAEGQHRHHRNRRDVPCNMGVQSSIDLGGQPREFAESETRRNRAQA
jgi:hypothetical protein